MTRPLLAGELAAFLTQGNSTIVATRNAAREPHVTRACGLRLLDAERLVILLPRPTSGPSLANVRNNGELALNVSSPRNFRGVQLKGRCLAIGEPTALDRAAAEEQFAAFAEAIRGFGNSRAKARNLWLFDCTAVELEVHSAFTQTPGPGAGEPLKVSDES